MKIQERKFFVGFGLKVSLCTLKEVNGQKSHKKP